MAESVTRNKCITQSYTKRLQEIPSLGFLITQKYSSHLTPLIIDRSKIRNSVTH